MDDAQLLRYARHILLPELGVEGQAALLAAHALIVGAGGLGSPVAMYLASAGVGRITLIDDDSVELSNLQRQIAHTTARIGQTKVASAAQALRDLNPDVIVTALAQRANAAWLAQHLNGFDVVLDCSDNFATRHAVNAACVAASVPLVWAAAVQMDAQVSVFDPRVTDCPCYACLFPLADGAQDAACATMGVLSPWVGVVGSLQATEALRVLTRQGLQNAGVPVHDGLSGQLLMMDARRMGFDKITVRRQLSCAICGVSHAA
jgi:molybdopterin-synthase adenylyltransferase